MPAVSFTLNVSNKALRELLASRGTKIQKARIVKAPTTSSAAAPTPSTQMAAAPAKAPTGPLGPVENPAQYLHTPGTATGRQGRPFKLNQAGLKLVFSYSKQGYNPSEISRAFGGIIGPEAVRRFVTNVKKG